MKITVRKAAAWFFGINLILGGLLMTTETVLGGLVAFSVGLFLIPNVRQRISDRFGVGFSTWMVVLIAVIGMGISGAMIPTDSTDTAATGPEDVSSSPSSISNTDNQQPEESQENSAESRTHSVGEYFTVGQIAYSVKGVRTAQVIGSNPYLQEQADGQFVLVNIEVTNRGQESTRISDTHMKLVDSQDRSYSVDTDAFVSLENGFTFRQLNPGLSESGTLVYDTPPNQEGRKLEVSPAAIFSSGQPHYVDLEG